jgi:uncharacterized protein YndB with AHSA1/START domain
MRTFHKTVDIAARPERVWKIMVDVERWPEWTKSMQTIRRLEGGPFVLGSRAWISQPKLRPSVWTVTQFDAGHSFTWSASGPGFRVLGIHGVEPIEDGSRVTLSIRFEGLLGGIMGRLLRKLNVEYMDMEAAGLKLRSEKV